MRQTEKRRHLMCRGRESHLMSARARWSRTMMFAQRLTTPFPLNSRQLDFVWIPPSLRICIDYTSRVFRATYKPEKEGTVLVRFSCVHAHSSVPSSLSGSRHTPSYHAKPLLLFRFLLLLLQYVAVRTSTSGLWLS